MKIDKRRLLGPLCLTAVLLWLPAALGAYTATPDFNPVQRPETLTISNGHDKPVVMINTTTGKVTLGSGVAPDEAAAAFWKAVETMLPERGCP